MQTSRALPFSAGEVRSVDMSLAVPWCATVLTRATGAGDVAVADAVKVDFAVGNQWAWALSVESRADLVCAVVSAGTGGHRELSCAVAAGTPEFVNLTIHSVNAVDAGCGLCLRPLLCDAGEYISPDECDDCQPCTVADGGHCNGTTRGGSCRMPEYANPWVNFGRFERRQGGAATMCVGDRHMCVVLEEVRLFPACLRVIFSRLGKSRTVV